MNDPLRLITLVLILGLMPGGALAAQGRGPGSAAADYDVSVYADRATALLVALASEHHRFRTDQLRGYRANVFTRAEGRISTGRFSRGLQLFTFETASIVYWQNPGDVRVDVQGARSSTARLPYLDRDQMKGFWTDVITSEPWFIPASLGDYIQLMGIPDEEALHPLARRGPRFYRYAISDSLRMSLPGRTVRAIAVSIEPSVAGPTLLSGTMWLDADSLDVVRLMATIVGDDIWEDEEDSPEMVTMEIDLEYGLHDNRFWLPFRQIVTPTFVYKYLPGATLPTSAVTTFSDYDISVDTAITLVRLPPGVTGRRFGPSWRCEPWEFDDRRRGRDRCGERGFVRSQTDADGFRWDIVVPSLDSLDQFDFGTEFEAAEEVAAEELIRQRIGDMAALSEDLPPEFGQPRQALRIDWGQLLQTFQYNRVQGASLGGGYALEPGPAFTTLLARARFSFGDLRPTAALTWRRDAPRGRLDIEAFRSLRQAEPWTEGTPIGNSLKALFSGHDDADYYLAAGGGLRYTGYQGFLRNVDLTLRFERQRSTSLQSGSSINDFFFGSGAFQPNPPIAAGDFARASVVRSFYADRASFRFGVDGQWSDELSGGRAWGSATMPYWLGPSSGFFRLRAGTSTANDLPQLRFRVGGPETVRGYTYGVRRGDHFWSAQWEQELGDPTWWAPVIFADVGDVVTPDYTFDPLVGLGFGASLLSGWVRLDLAKGVNPSTAVRFDLLFRMPL